MSGGRVGDGWTGTVNVKRRGTGADQTETLIQRLVSGQVYFLSGSPVARRPSPVARRPSPVARPPLPRPPMSDREIERKYLLTGLPPRARTAPSLHIHQGYLPGNRITERVRRAVSDDGSGTHYYRTIKSGRGIERFEIEDETDEAFFTAVWPL